MLISRKHQHRWIQSHTKLRTQQVVLCFSTRSKLTAKPLKGRRLTDIPCSIRSPSRMGTFESKLPLQSVITSCPPPSSLWSQPAREWCGGNQVEQGHSHPTFFPSRLKQSPSSPAGSDTQDKTQEHLQCENDYSIAIKQLLASVVLSGMNAWAEV